MAPKVGGLRIIGLYLLLTIGLAVLGVPPASAAEHDPCRVRNVTQDTRGRSLIRMIEKAKDGDRLRVGGSCSGEVVVDVDLTITGAGDGATLTGGAARSVVQVGAATRVRLRNLTIAGNDRAGIHTAGRLTLVRTIVRDNGVGIRVNRHDGHLGLFDSQVVHNRQAGIHAKGAVKLTQSQVDDNGGPGISVIGRVGLVRSDVRRNGGGGLVARRRVFATYRMWDSTVASNAGPGIEVRGGALLAVRTMIARNEGGGIDAGNEAHGDSSVVVLVDTTVNANVSSGSGGGIVFDLSGITIGRLTLLRSVVRATQPRAGVAASRSAATSSPCRTPT
jgi:hypothetical protein